MAHFVIILIPHSLSNDFSITQFEPVTGSKLNETNGTTLGHSSSVFMLNFEGAYCYENTVAINDTQLLNNYV